MSLTDKVIDLAGSIKKTREHVELKQAQSWINKNPELKKRVEDIRRKQQEVLSTNSNSEEIKFKIHEINEEIKRLSTIPEVNSYLIAGNSFANMMSTIYKTIYDLIESDLKKI
jgi:cell fate (sporulation/competence/biofilm development) regulator YmcA (YheA/YmcA/DUF963 family)